MPKNKYNTKNFINLRFLTSCVGLGRDKDLRKICEKIEELKMRDNPSPNSKAELLEYTTKFEKYIISNTKQSLENKILRANSTGYELLKVVQENGFFRIKKLFENHGISLKKQPFNTSQSFFHDPQKNIDKCQLMQAAKRNNPEEIKELIEKGAHINRTDKFGRTALYVAVYNGYTKIVQLLLEKGAADAGIKLLNIAAYRSDISIAQLLLTHGFNVNGGDEQGSTALHVAAEKGHVEIIKLLLAYRADITIRDIDGCTALDLVPENRNDIKMLLQHAITNDFREAINHRISSEILFSSQTSSMESSEESIGSLVM